MGQVFANFAGSTLAADLAAGDTACTVASAASFPAMTTGQWMYAVLADQAETVWEIVKVTALATATFTITRAQDGTTARAWPAGSKFQCRPVAQSIRDLMWQASDMGTGISFGPGDGVTVGYQMDRRISSVSQVYREDWQGHYPIYAVAITNPITFPEDFSNAAWVKGSNATISADATTAPNGTLTADKWIESSAAGVVRSIYHQYTIPSTGTYCLSVHALNNGRRYLTVYPQTSSTGYAIFDLVSGVVTATGGGQFVKATIKALAGGWYRCSVAITTNAQSMNTVMCMSNSSTTPAPSYDGDGASGFYLWGAQLDVGSDPVSYRSGTVTDYSINSTFFITFASAPAAAAVLTADVTYYPGLFGGSFWLNTSTNRLGSTYAMGREVLTAARTYYVRSDGNDANTGLTNVAGGAFLTIQKAVDVVAGNLDMGIYQVTIQVGAGTYAAVSLKSCLGALPVILLGDTVTPSNVLLSNSSAQATLSCVGATNLWTIKGFKVTATGTASYGVMAHQGALVNLYEMDFGACVTAHVTARQGGMVQLLANYTISGASGCHLDTVTSGIIQGSGRTVTVSGTPAFSIAFARSLNFSGMQVTTFTFSGSATGPRYSINGNSVINCGGVSTYFPGDSAGSAATGGQYL